MNNLSQIIDLAKVHIEQATTKRNFYKAECDKSRYDFEKGFTISNLISCLLPFRVSITNSRDITLHLSFDFAQQMHYPSNPLQPEPIYFLTPRKCGLFGVCCEGIPRQVNIKYKILTQHANPLQINYLIDESCDTGKGSNMVVSLLHDFFSNFSLWEVHQCMHADNRIGQNKNNTVIQVE